MKSENELSQEIRELIGIAAQREHENLDGKLAKEEYLKEKNGHGIY